MKANDRIKSEYNTGTVLAVSDPVSWVMIQYDGFAWPIKVPVDIACDFAVIGKVEVAPEIPADFDVEPKLS